MPYVIKENSPHSRAIETLEHTKRETAEECFKNFVRGDVEEVSKEDIINTHSSWCNDNNEDTTLEYWLKMSDHTDISVLSRQRIFDCWDGYSANKYFGYDNEPDWNEMLQYRYGSFASPRGAEAKYFICEEGD